MTVSRSPRRRLAALTVAAALAALPLPLRAQGGAPSDPAESPAPPAERRLVLESIELAGNERTSVEAVRRIFPLAEGDPVDPASLLAAVEELRASELFRSVELETRAGSERGRVRVVLHVEERGVEFRFGTGFHDLDGWYLIPAQIRLDNRLGRGERVRIQAIAGYRIAGVELVLEEPNLGPDGRTYWGAKLGGYGTARQYWANDVEYRHELDRGEMVAWLGRRLGRGWSVEGGARFERVEADSTPTATEDDELRGVEKGDELFPWQLPDAIAAHLGEATRTVWHAQVALDTRSPRRIAATPVSGLWGRLRVEGILLDGPDAGVATVDVRAYRRIGGGAIAARVRGGVMGAAPWYDRFYLGGLYTVRGFPGQSLSPAAGDSRFWTASLEWRAPLVGRPDEPLLVGVLFVDGGHGWSGSDYDAEPTAAAAGWGARFRLPWVGHVGLDFGVPLTDSPREESFRAHAALGWNF
jgi:outer membrane protein insertion porin family